MILSTKRLKIFTSKNKLCNYAWHFTRIKIVLLVIIRCDKKFNKKCLSIFHLFYPISQCMYFLYTLFLCILEKFYSQDFTLERDSSRKGFPTKMGDRTTGSWEETTKNGNVARPPGTCVRGHGRPAQKRHDRDIPWTCRELNISVMSW